MKNKRLNMFTTKTITKLTKETLLLTLIVGIVAITALATNFITENNPANIGGKASLTTTSSLQALTPEQQTLLANYNNRPPTFLKNMGQWNSDILYQGGHHGIAVRFLANSLSFATSREIEEIENEQENSNDNNPEREDSYESLVYNLDFQNANSATTSAPITATGEQPSKINYLKGNNPEKWVVHTPQYQTLTYPNLYNNIDLTFYAQGNNLKYDFILKPGARISDIQLHYRGITSLFINTNGELEVRTPWGVVADQSPYGYQVINNQKQEVNIEYTLLNNNTFGFKILGLYDPTQELIIDPLTLIWSTFMGATAFNLKNYATDIDIGTDGHAYVTGRADDSYPTKPGVYQEKYAGGVWDAFVTKIKSDGTSVIYSTFIGGSLEDEGIRSAVNKNGEIFVTGRTTSKDFPTTPGAYQTQLKGQDDNFIVKLNNMGTGLIYSTYLGGTGVDTSSGITINKLDEAFVIGWTYSLDFPTTSGAGQTQLNGVGTDDAFITKINNLGTGLVYSTYLGGNGYDAGFGIAINKFNEAFITGYTSSSDFPTTLGAFQTQLNGQFDVFVTKINNLGTGLVYSTYLGGANGAGGQERGKAIVVNHLDEAFITGFTESPTFPTTPGAVQTQYNQPVDVFVTKINNLGTGLVYSTYLGGNYAEQGWGIAINSLDEAFVTGFTGSSNFPVTPGAYQTVFGTGSVGDFFISHISADGKSFGTGGSTYFGGTRNEYYDPAVSIDLAGSIVYITGTTHSDDFPIQDRFGIIGPSADVYYSTKPNPGNWDQPVAIKMGLQVAPSTCGNNIVEPAEECDEGANNSPTGICTTDCTLTYCTDGAVQQPNGEGVGGPNNDGWEVCDDGNTNDNDACKNNCTLGQLPPCGYRCPTGCPSPHKCHIPPPIHPTNFPKPCGGKCRPANSPCPPNWTCY